MEDCKNIFVLFAPGLGGNHVTNLLSTDSHFACRATIADYQSNNQVNAHVNNSYHLHIDNIDKKQCGHNSLFCAHWGEMYWLKQNGMLDWFPKRQIVLLKIPDENTIAYQRFQKHNGLGRYFIEEQRSIYSPAMVQKTLGDKDFHEIDCDLIFTRSIDRLVEFARHEMELNLNRDMCDEMHNIWFGKILNFLESRT